MRVTIYLFFSFLFLCSQHLLKAAPYAGMLSSRVYVKVGGTGNGSSWATATGDLQTAIDNASGATEIWVAAGTYKPAAYPTGCVGCSSTRDYAFYVKDGISLYGGFVGTETLLSERNIATNITILSGDIGTPSDNTDNCYHVVVTSSPSSGGGGVTIDGFTITGGNANGSGEITLNENLVEQYIGGGIFTVYGTNTLSNNTVYNNSGDYAGGIAINSGTNTLTYNTLYNNISPSYEGGGIAISGGNNTLSNNTLYNNSATGNKAAGFGNGGAITIYEGTNTLTNNTLHHNSATNWGGGISTNYGTNTMNNNTLYNNSTGTVGGGIATYESNNTLSNNTLHDNSAGTDGGGIYTELGTNMFTGNTLNNNSAGTNGGGVYTNLGTNIFTGNTVSNNSVVLDGGGIYTYYGTNTFTGNVLNNNLTQYSTGGGIFTNYGTNTFTNNKLSNNSSLQEGGGIYTYFGTNTLIGNTLYNNSASQGGGIFAFRSTNTLTNNTLYNNSAGQGGGILIYVGLGILTNNIFWNNRQGGNNNVAGADLEYAFTIPIVTYCLTQAGSYYSSGTGIINNQDPLFVNAAAGNFRLQANSPCVNVGSNGAWTGTGLTTDLAGTTRPIGVVDLGAYEYNPVLPIELLSFTGKGTEGGNLLTWETANEVNNKGFQVERLAPPTPSKGENWEVLGFKTANNKAGTYEFMDNAPLPISTYRLRQIDFDGKETLSKVISIAATGKGKLKAYPNPVSDVLTIETTEISDYQIYNLLGQQVLNGKATQRIDVSALPQGTYFLKVGAEQVKFMKQ